MADIPIILAGPGSLTCKAYSVNTAPCWQYGDTSEPHLQINICIVQYQCACKLLPLGSFSSTVGRGVSEVPEVLYAYLIRFVSLKKDGLQQNFHNMTSGPIETGRGRSGRWDESDISEVWTGNTPSIQLFVQVVIIQDHRCDGPRSEL